MKRRSLIAVLALVIIMTSTAISFAGTGFELVSSYPNNGQTNTSIENLGIKLYFSKDVNGEAVKAANAKRIKLVDEDNKQVPVQVLFSDEEGGLVLAVADINEGNYTVKNNSEYRCIIDADFADNDGETLGDEIVISFKTYNQKANNAVNAILMFVMFGGIMFFSVRQNNKKEEDEKEKDGNKEAFNPYKEAKRTGRPVEEIKAEQAKKEAKEAARRARKKARNDEEASSEKHIDNCAQYLTNVYHVHAPAPVNKADRSIEALRAMRRSEKKAAKAAREAAAKKRASKK